MPACLVGDDFHFIQRLTHPLNIIHPSRIGMCGLSDLSGGDRVCLAMLDAAGSPWPWHTFLSEPTSSTTTWVTTEQRSLDLAQPTFRTIASRLRRQFVIVRTRSWHAVYD